MSLRQNLLKPPPDTAEVVSGGTEVQAKIEREIVSLAVRLSTEGAKTNADIERLGDLLDDLDHLVADLRLAGGQSSATA